MAAAPSPVILIFARAPVIGCCKTRLIPRYGAKQAAAWHARLVHRTLLTAISSGLEVQLWTEPSPRHAFFLACRRRYGVSLRRQARGDLGRKMGQAIDAQVRAGRAVLLIGTDCPALGVPQLQSALAALAGADAVLQPAEDGGYVLLGARRAIAGRLRGIAWSSGRECAQTRRRLQQYGLRYAELPLSWDVDHPPELRRARRLNLLQT